MQKNIPTSVADHLLKEAGEQRVSKEAKQELQQALEKRCKQIGTLAFKFAKHSGRKTIRKEDIELALEHLQ